jgi:RNA-directed DNA polymerase
MATGSEHSPRLNLATRSDVAAYLGVPLPRLTYLFYVLEPARRYTAFQLERKHGGPPRVIHAPVKPVKLIQATLASGLKSYYRIPHVVHGYVPARSIVTKARVHRRQRWVLRVDLENFFPSINFGRVQGLFLKPPFSFPPEVASLLANICCHNNQLPQGAPTSPLISNLICRRLDRTLALLAAGERCYYTRYCDDLVFSTSRPSFPSNLASVDSHTGFARAATSLRQVIENNGFRLNETKTILRKRTQRQLVTGLVTNEFVNVPRDYVRSLRILLHVWGRYGPDAALAALAAHHVKNRPARKAIPSLNLVVRGKLQHVGAIKGWSSPVYRSLARRLKSLDQDFRPTTRFLESPPTILRIIPEGRTDYVHLRSAVRYFKNKGLFTDLDLVFDGGFEDKGGDSELLKTCQTLRRIWQTPPVVCVFDRDNPKLLPQVMEPEDHFKDWGNNVFSIAIPPPQHRDSSQPFCIELLYTDDVLERRDGNGRRIYLKREFDPDTGRHQDEHVYCTNPKSEGLVKDDVFDMAEGSKVSLSKKAFADAISAARLPYSDVSFDGFNDLFLALRAVRVHLLTR